MKDNLPLGSMSYCVFNYLVYSKKKKTDYPCTSICRTGASCSKGE